MNISPDQGLQLQVFHVPGVGAVYDRPQFGGLHSSKSRAVIDRPYSGIQTEKLSRIEIDLKSKTFQKSGSDSP